MYKSYMKCYCRYKQQFYFKVVLYKKCTHTQLMYVSTFIYLNLKQRCS